MKWSLSSILRTVMWLAVGLSVLAVALGRSAAPKTQATYREASVRYHGVNMHCCTEEEPHPCFIDRQTGQILHLQFSPEDSLDYAVCSPWCDERGQFHAVSRWMNRSGKVSDYLPQDFGVARFTVPEGRLLDRVKLDHVPVGDACWVPGVTPRIIFSSGDGKLYGYQFGDSGRGHIDEAGDCAKTQPVVWRSTPPGTGLLYIRDLIWPADAKLGGRMIASMSYRILVNGQPRMCRPQLWWLKLNEDATAVETAGQLTVPDPDDDPAKDFGIEERLPNIITTANGELALAYLSRRGSRSLWDLNVAAITIDPETGVPTAGSGGSQGLAGGFLPSAPTFSADGRLVYGIRNHDQVKNQIVARRFSIADVLAQADAAPRRADRVGFGPAIADSGTAVPITGVFREPGPPRADSTLLGWANLGIFDPNWLVKTGAGRHAGE
jgi:hypothetical protein